MPSAIRRDDPARRAHYAEIRRILKDCATIRQQTRAAERLFMHTLMPFTGSYAIHSLDAATSYGAAANTTATTRNPAGARRCGQAEKY
jgi:hypothetical protein